MFVWTGRLRLFDVCRYLAVHCGYEKQQSSTKWFGALRTQLMHKWFCIIFGNVSFVLEAVVCDMTRRDGNGNVRFGCVTLVCAQYFVQLGSVIGTRYFCVFALPYER